MTFACRGCANEGDLYADGGCARCVLRDRVQDLLSSQDGPLPPQLQPITDALMTMEIRARC